MAERRGQVAVRHVSGNAYGVGIGPAMIVAIAAYLALLALWLYTLAVCIARARATRSAGPLVSRLYIVLIFGASCAVVACINDISRLVLAMAAPTQIVSSIIVPFVANAAALVAALAFAVRGSLREIERYTREQGERRRELEALVGDRTAELAQTVERLDAGQRERERIANELRAEHAMLDAIMKTSVGAICVVSAEGRIVFANSMAQSVLGVSAAETTQRTYNSPEWRHTDLDGNPLPEEQQPFRRVMAARGPIQGMRHAIVWPDGTSRTLEINGAPLFDADGGVSGVVFLVTDITQRMADEEIVRDSEKRFRLMVEGLPSGAVFVEGDRIYMNSAAERITGYSRTELSTVDQWFWALYGESSREARAKYERIRDTGFTEVCVGTIRRKDGATCIIDCNGYRSENAVVWLLRDITDLSRAAEDRRRLEARVFKSQPAEDFSVIAEGIAHDCNNILTSILGAAELAQHEVPAGDTANGYLDEIARGAERAADLCGMMMALTADSGRTPGPVDLNAAILDTVRFMQGPEGNAGGVVFEFDLDGPAPMPCADASQIRQVLLALLKNAVDAIGEGGGTVRVFTHAYTVGTTSGRDALPEGEYVCVSVSDTGCGMGPETKAKACEPFFTTKAGADGLGLTQAAAIVNALGGAIVIESEQGKGATVHISLPAAEIRASAEVPATAPVPLWYGSGTILVVDDEQNVRSIIKRMLEKLGFEVVLAASGREALDQVEQRRDLAAVILDLAMPNMDGGATLEQIRRNRPQLPVLIATGYDVKKVTGRFPTGTISSFLQKPFAMHVLSEHLRDVLDPHTAAS